LAYAYSKGVTIVAAAGNDGQDQVDYPAAYDDYVIAVSATRFDEQLTAYSNYGSSIDLAAPGGDLSVDQNGDGSADGVLQNTFNPHTKDTADFGYYFFQGTSMASPHVAGVAALVVSQGIADPSQVRSILESTAEDKGVAGVDSFYGYGIVDAAAALASLTSLNTAPSAVDDAASTQEDSAVVLNVLSNDYDDDGDALTVSSVTAPLSGSAVLNSDNTITYTPNADYNGSDSFSYTVSDGNGGSDTATVSITVDAVNDAPVASGDSATTQEGTAVTIDVLANDSDVDGDALSVDAVTQPADGTVVINADHTLTYTPNSGFQGGDSFTYTISDGNGGSDSANVAIEVTATNDAPVADDDLASTNEDNPVSIDVLANDSDADGDVLTTSNVTAASHGVVVINSDNTITYTPNANFNGSDSFTYTVSDGNGGSDTATVSLTVHPVNDAPVASADSATTEENTQVTINVLENDSDVDGDSLSVDSVTQPTNGAVVINADNTLAYVPDSGYTGSDSFNYTIVDGNGGSDSANVTVDVQPAVPSTSHVGDLDGTTHVKGRSGWWEAFVTATIHDGAEQPVSDAIVTGTWSGDASGTVSGTTASDGTVTFATGNLRSSSGVTFTIDDVSSSLTYDPAENHDPDGDSDGTSISVNKDGSTSAASAFENGSAVTDNGDTSSGDELENETPPLEPAQLIEEQIDEWQSSHARALSASHVSSEIADRLFSEEWADNSTELEDLLDALIAP